ncbi:Fimbrial protein [Pontiella desulfatans]|uniref:Fimbrial protein n=1 Tax=Pontiella desulfatans TaxID=2750659 RepID=A0A6C2U7E7_PONDE|nr:prepilin-type N-terminal cleavage/methylation domain-containing protein [Pontiella desulfatans]VGO15950.1 Fimbrial protein [Pontiella desulfatans]
MKTNKKGFTLVEIMIVVAIIGLLAAIGIPSFAKARDNSRTKACVNNLRIIDAAKEQCAMEEDNSIDNAAQYIKGLAYPTCPTDGAAYTTGLLGVDPACAGADAATHNAAF